MRPKKKVLLVDPDVDRRGMLRYLLTICGFAPIAVSSAEEALEVGAMGMDGAVIHYAREMRWDGCNELALALKAQRPGIGVVIVSSTAKSSSFPVHYGDSFLGKDASRAELLECIRVVTARKSGPRRPVTYASEVSHAAATAYLTPSEAK